MKKNIKITTTILAVLTAFLFTSCFDPIYDVVLHDVKPEKATVSSHMINSIARYESGDKEYLVLAANGGLRYKPADAEGHGHWATYSGLPFTLPHNDFDTGNTEGEAILKVVADKDYLYLVTAKYNKGYPSETKIWVLTGGWNGTWGTVNLDKISLAPNLFNVFSNNDFDSAKRSAYLRVNTPPAQEGESTTYKYYKLNGTTINEVTSNVEANNITGGAVNSVTNFNGTDFFFSSNAAVANGTYFYYSVGNELYYGTKKEDVTSSGSAGASIASLALTNNSIIIGCGTGSSAGGIKHAYLTEGVPGTISNNFSTNAAAQIPGSYQVPCVLNATPTEKEAGSQLYAAVTFSGVPAGINKESDKGLWSYYPNRGNWNRE